MIAGELDGYSRQVTWRLGELVDSLSEPLRSPVRSLVERPGKRLRSSLLAACAGFGDPDGERLVRLGALVELLHMASLLHDDVIDRAAIRRGAPAAHRVIGDEMALLAGLACFSLAGTEAADLGAGVDRMVSRTAAGLAYGEMLDVERAFDTSLGLPNYLELVERKTGDLFRLTCLLGATEARLRTTQARALAQFGTAFGVAFQILDDCLDLVADAGDKPVGTDHLLGLFGAPTLCALQVDSGEELSTVLLSPSLDVGDLPKVRALVVEGGGLAAARRLAQEWYDWALAALDPLPRGEAHTLLTATAERVWTGGR